MRNISLIFFLLIFFTSCVTKSKNSDCFKCRTGNFIYYYKLGNDTIIVERNDSVQVEKTTKNGFITKSKINWISDCDFYLTFISSSDSDVDSIADYIKKNKLETHIVKVEKEFYTFESKMSGVDQLLKDTMWFNK